MTRKELFISLVRAMFIYFTLFYLNFFLLKALQECWRHINIENNTVNLTEFIYFRYIKNHNRINLNKY